MSTDQVTARLTHEAYHPCYRVHMSNDEWKLPWTGACRCGQVTMQITAPPLVTMACHCTGCQRMTSSAFSLSVLVPAIGFAVSSGETVVGGLHGGPRHQFCPHCMSWMFTRPEGMDDLVNVRSTLLDIGGALDPFMETWTSEKLPWANTPAVHSFPALPELSAFPAIILEYSKHGARPSTPA